MQPALSVPVPSSALPAAAALGEAAATSAYAGYQIIRRNGAVVVFEPNKIAVALMKAFLAVHGTQGAASASVRETVEGLTEAVVRALLRSRPGGGTFHIEDVQDHVELGLMRGGHHEVARAYVLYRERRTQERARAAQSQPAATTVAGPDPGVLDRYRLQILTAAARFKRYPRSAIDNNWEGEVVVRMAIGADGRIAALGIKSSSGHEILDRQALEMFRIAKPFVLLPPELAGREFELELRAIYGLKDQGSG